MCPGEIHERRAESLIMFNCSKWISCVDYGDAMKSSRKKTSGITQLSENNPKFSFFYQSFCCKMRKNVVQKSRTI